MTIPSEFKKESVADASENVEIAYRQLAESRNYNATLIADNPWIQTPASDEELRWGEGL